MEECQCPELQLVGSGRLILLMCSGMHCWWKMIKMFSVHIMTSLSTRKEVMGRFSFLCDVHLSRDGILLFWLPFCRQPPCEYVFAHQQRTMGRGSVRHRGALLWTPLVSCGKKGNAISADQVKTALLVWIKSERTGSRDRYRVGVVMMYLFYQVFIYLWSQS